MRNYFKKQKSRYKFILNIIDFLESQDINYKETSTGEIIIQDCPSCGREYKLYVEEETGVFQCKYAGCDFLAGGGPYKLIQSLAPEMSKSKVFKLCFGSQEAENLDLDDMFDFSESESTQRDRVNEIKEIELPSEAVLLTKDHLDGWNYLINRGLSETVINDLNIYIIPHFDYKKTWEVLHNKGLSPEDIKINVQYLNRVIFTVKTKNKLLGFVARDFSGKVSGKYKALNSPGSWRTNSLWNYDNLSSDKLILCEGIMDAVKFGKNHAVAALGTAVSVNQLELIKTSGAKKVYFGFDSGTESAKEKIAEDLAIYFPGEIYDIILPDLLISKETFNQEIIDKIEEITKFKVSNWESNELLIPYDKFEILKKYRNANILDLEGSNLLKLETIIDKAQYKDAGDYTTEELAAFIKNAKRYSKKRDLF